MRITGFLIGTILFALTGCGDDGPTKSDIEEGYRNLAIVNMERAAQEYGSVENIPPFVAGFIQMTALVDLTECQKEVDDTGWICIYNVTPVNSANVVLEEVRDIKGRVYRGDLGWMVFELEDQN